MNIELHSCLGVIDANRKLVKEDHTAYMTLILKMHFVVDVDWKDLSKLISRRRRRCKLGLFFTAYQLIFYNLFQKLNLYLNLITLF